MSGATMRNLAVGIVLLLSYAAYAQGALTSPLLDPGRPQHVAAASQIVREAELDTEAERHLAELYWQRYPDVAADRDFGRKGRHGILGAREHFKHHGRYEGRIWGLEGTPQPR